MDIVIGCHPDKLGWEQINSMPFQYHHRSSISWFRADLAHLSVRAKIRKCTISSLPLKRKLYSLDISRKPF